MKAKDYFEQIKPHVGADSLPNQLGKMIKAIIFEGRDIAKQRNAKKSRFNISCF